MTGVTTGYDSHTYILYRAAWDAAHLALEVGLFRILLTTPWLKVLLDLWEHRGRTLVVALAIAVGVYAVGVVLNTREILVREYRQDQVGALMASAVVRTAPFDKDLADSIARLPLVAAAEGRTTVSGRVLRPDGTPQEIEIVAIPDFNKLTIDSFAPLRGAYPPARRETVAEGASFASLKAQVGDEITVELNNDATRTLRLVGTVHDGQRFSPKLAGAATLYVTPETLQTLGYSSVSTDLYIRATEPAHDKAHILAALDQVEAQLKDSGRTIYSREVITESRADPFIGSIVLILTAFGLVILALSSFLVVNAMSALITQQVPQIGVMKLIGARRSQIMALYLATVLIYGLLAVLIALPLAAVTARLLMNQVVEPLLNVRVLSYAIPLPLLGAQAAIGLLLPLIAGLAPVIRGTRITTHQALNDVGLGGAEYGRSIVERLLDRVQRVWRVQRPVLLAVRNTLRHKGRLVQTLIVLVFGTALFISVISVRESVNATLDTFMRFHRYDVSVQMEHPDLVTRLESTASEVPGVGAVEVWSSGGATRVRPNDSKSNPFRVVAVPPGTHMMDPEVISGQWLAGVSGTPNAVVINSDLVDDERDLRVGSDVLLDINDRKTTWHVVGIVSTESRGPAVYVSRDDYAYATRSAGQGDRVQVSIAAGAKISQHDMANRLRAYFDSRGLKVTDAQTAAVTQTQNNLLFTVVVSFLILMALLLAAVGGLGLTTTMSINIMERVREVGVLRAIGASNGSVRQIVLAEGIAMAVISWLIGTLISLGLAPLFSAQLGLALIKIPLQYHYSFLGAAVWFVVLLAIATVASLAPARNAVRLTVREVLAYE
jgi:putative ABC transport system permease protein